jgi:phosphatidylinositol alpha-1,6-mannosyltransferase
MADFGVDEIGGARPLQLAFVSHCLTPQTQAASRIGGAERAAAELLAALRRRDDLVVTPIPESAADDPFRVLAFAGRTVAQLRSMARARKLDAVLFTAMPTAWMTLAIGPARRSAGVVVGAICHGHDVIMEFAPYQALVRRTFGALNAVMPVSRATGERCLERGLDPRRMHVTPNGVDAARFAPAPPAAARRDILRAAFPAEAASLPDGGLVLCTVGRQIRRKGHAWFVRNVMPRLPEDVCLWLIGEGPEAPAIESAAAAAGIAARVRRLGAAPEAQLAALYRGADLFVMPNIPTPGDIEGFGLVMLEANLNGLPAIAADLEGVAEVVTDGVNGRLARAGDAVAFANVILELRNDGVRRALGVSAEAHARERFGWAAVAEQHARLLKAARRSAVHALARGAPAAALEPKPAALETR